MRLRCLLVTLIGTLSLATGAVHAQSAGGGGALAPRAPGAGASPALDTEAPRANDALALAIYRELVEINTITATGDTAQAAEAMARRLRDAGFAASDVQVFKPAPRKGNLVARLRGSGARRPLLLLAHIDVVEARGEQWQTDPFRLTEKDGYFHGRGTSDDKFMAAAFVANLIRYRQEGYQPQRDIVLVLETDEEILDADAMGIQWLIAHQRDLIDAEFALNEGGSVVLKDGRPRWNTLQTSEKVSVFFKLEVHDAGGHSAVPTRSNAIYRLAAGLERLATFEFPLQLTDTTRAWLDQMARIETEPTRSDMRAVLQPSPDAQALRRLSASPSLNAQLRTTCVATLIEGGQATNALPQRAAATVNCRLMPGTTVESVRETLAVVLAEPAIVISPIGVSTVSDPSPLRADLMAAIESVSAEFWPGAPILPTMSAGATDGTFLRNAGIPTYGHSGMAMEQGESRAHGLDERVPVGSFYKGVEYLYRLVRRLAGPT